MGVIATCHCGACEIGLTSAPDVATDCNCSICRRYGALWAYFDPAEVDMTGMGPTDIYMQGDRALEFHRCAACGVLTHWAPGDRTRPRMGVNARLLPLEMLKALRVRRLDGADTWTYLDE